MAPEEDPKTDSLLDLLAQFHAIEQMLLLQSSTAENKDDGDQDALWVDVVPPYCPRPNGPRVTLLSALSLVNRYCATLPCDASTVLAPEWKLAEMRQLDGVEEQYLEYVRALSSARPRYFQCRLLLPLNSPLRDEIVGQVMPSKRLAKRVTAMATCIRLHQISALDDRHLLPMTKRSQTQRHANDQATAAEQQKYFGTRSLYYRKEVPGVFRPWKPAAGRSCYLYLITYETSPATGDDRRWRSASRLELDSAERRLGFLANGQLPPLNTFPIFTKFGPINVGVLEISDRLVLDQQGVDACQQFQTYVASEILQLEADDLRPSDAHLYPYLIVPVRLADVQIDWAYIGQLLDSPIRRQNMAQMMAESNRTAAPLSSCYDAFKDAVVIPCHKKHSKVVGYYVDAVSTLTAASPFPNSAYTTYQQFYHSRYQIDIANTDQRLLQVSKQSSQYNVLMPK